MLLIIKHSKIEHFNRHYITAMAVNTFTVGKTSDDCYDNQVNSFHQIKLFLGYI